MAKEKTKRVVKYEVTSKDGKELLAKENTSQAAAMYRALAAADKPLSIAECYAKCEGKMENGAAWERLGKNLNSTLFALRKTGYVKRLEERIAIVKKAKAAKRARKPRASKPESSSRSDAKEAAAA